MCTSSEVRPARMTTSFSRLPKPETIDQVMGGSSEQLLLAAADEEACDRRTLKGCFHRRQRRD